MALEWLEEAYNNTIDVFEDGYDEIFKNNDPELIKGSGISVGTALIVGVAVYYLLNKA